MIALIGSRALRHWCHWIKREPKDVDLVGPYAEIKEFVRSQGSVTECYPISDGKKYVFKVGTTIVEAEIAWPGSLAERLLSFIAQDERTEIVGDCLHLASPDVLYMLKMSHRFLKNSPHFRKTMQDIHALREYGARMRDEHREFFKAREKATYDYGHPRLGVTKQDFFTGDGVTYVYDHDTIHEAMAHFGKPAYKFYQPADSQVNVSRVAFFEQPEHIRLHGVLEEAYVLALERAIIPFDEEIGRKRAFNRALEKICTSITSGFFRDYAWENWDRVQALYRDDYVDRFREAVQAGTVKLYSA